MHIMCKGRGDIISYFLSTHFLSVCGEFFLRCKLMHPILGLEDELKWAIEFCWRNKVAGKVNSVAFNSYVALIRQERNMQIFQDKRVESYVLVTKLIFQVQQLFEAFDLVIKTIDKCSLDRKSVV